MEDKSSSYAWHGTGRAESWYDMQGGWMVALRKGLEDRRSLNSHSLQRSGGDPNRSC